MKRSKDHLNISQKMAKCHDFMWEKNKIGNGTKIRNCSKITNLNQVLIESQLFQITPNHEISF